MHGHSPGSIVQPWQVGSFSSLTRGHSIEQPDYDAEAVRTDWLETPVISQDRFGFPRGTNAGICLHSLFEHWDFRDTGPDWQKLVHKTLNEYGIDLGWTAVVCDWLSEVVKTPLTVDTTLTLDSISRDKRLDEMAFYFPVSELTANRLKQTLARFSEELPILNKVSAQLNFARISGFMKGFIDLVFEFEGRFYIADYKSNWLGKKPADYQQARLDEAMIMHDYPLQYLLYSLALHRYLKTRLPDYEPTRHFGGVYYLFIRGMSPRWERTGVYFDRPSEALLAALDHCMSGEAHD